MARIPLRAAAEVWIGHTGALCPMNSGSAGIIRYKVPSRCGGERSRSTFSDENAMVAAVFVKATDFSGIATSFIP